MVQRREKELFNLKIAFGIACILFGAVLLFTDIHNRKEKTSPEKEKIILWWHWFFILSLIFAGSVSYTIAAYFI